jgi:hypothetical protein
VNKEYIINVRRFEFAGLFLFTTLTGLRMLLINKP